MTNKYIERVRLSNFKKFTEFDVCLNSDMNVLIGDNGSGKSTLVLAIELVLGGNQNRIESLGVDSLINIQAIDNFKILDAPHRIFKNLPVCYLEVYLNEQNKFVLNGENNSLKQTTDGLRLELSPRVDLKGEIDQVLSNDNSAFPFEFYQINFSTFQGQSYTGYSRYMKHLLIDNTQISNEYATRSYIKNVYETHSKVDERNKLRFGYRQIKSDFSQNELTGINESMSEGHSFELRHGARSTLENDLTIAENGVQVENMGKGRQCFVRTEFALSKGSSNNEPDVVLLEEPENHLSHGSMNQLIKRINDSNGSQLLVTTHSSLISARLDLNKAIFLSEQSNQPIFLKDLDPDTAKFFSKAPITNILEFVLSSKILLVEGAAEFILLAPLYKNQTGNDILESDVHVASVGGLSFKRYLEIADLLKIKAAVITDNDGNFKENITEKYSNFSQAPKIHICADCDPANTTFEISFYNVNKDICDDLFADRVRSNTVLQYMLANKAEAAYQLLLQKADELIAPDYIQEAIAWISE
jgi:putative ATP-dependent endonuclease of OLD family